MIKDSILFIALFALISFIVSCLPTQKSGNNSTCEFIPKINRGPYYKLDSYDFGFLILEPVWDFIYEGHEENKERYNCLTPSQLNFMAWITFDGQVTNGGLSQFFYNGYGDLYPLVIEGLQEIGDYEMAKKIDNVVSKFKYSKWEIEYPDSDKSVYELEDYYYENNTKTMEYFETYIRNNPSQFLKNEEGDSMDSIQSGQIRTKYPNDSLMSEFKLLNNKIDGEYLEYSENGNLKERLFYENGIKKRKREIYFENGNPKSFVKYNHKFSCLSTTYFFEKGGKKKKECIDIESNRKKGEYVEYYQNGNLKEKSEYDHESNNVKKIKYHENGQICITYKKGSSRWPIIENGWLADGTQSLKNGTGYTLEEGLKTFPDTSTFRRYEEYKNGKRHGKSEYYHDNILYHYEEWKDHELHGYGRTYYNNGNIESETLYKNGESISSKSFKKFENPHVAVKVELYHKATYYESFPDYEIPDTPPELLNISGLEKAFDTQPSIFEPYGDDEIMTYQYRTFVDNKGKLLKKQFLTARNGFVDDQLEKSYKKMKFKPAYKNGTAVPSISIIRHSLYLDE